MSRQKFRQDLLDETLRKLHTVIPGIKSSVVVNRDGLLVAAFPPGDDYDSLAAMSGTLIGLAERVLDRLHQGELERLLMQSEEGVMVVYPAGRATLAVLVNNDQNLSPVLYAVSRTSKDVAEILKG